MNFGDILARRKAAYAWGIQRRKNLLTVHVLTGVILPEEIIEAVKSLYASNPTLHHLWDVTQADLTQINPKALDKIAASSDLGFGFGRMYEAFARVSGQMVEVRSFRSRREAEDWIAEATG
jgi:hypothetical protein